MIDRRHLYCISGICHLAFGRWRGSAGTCDEDRRWRWHKSFIATHLARRCIFGNVRLIGDFGMNLQSHFHRKIL